MKRKEAQQLVGKLVTAWTGLNGEYLGILRNLITEKGMPWRGNVEILAVLRYPTTGLGRGGFRHRKPLEKGIIRDFGGVNISLWRGKVAPDYDESVKNTLGSEIRSTLLVLKKTISERLRRGSDHLLISALKQHFKEWERITGQKHPKQQEFQQEWIEKRAIPFSTFPWNDRKPNQLNENNQKHY